MRKILKIVSIVFFLFFVMSCGDLPETFKVIYYTNGSTSGFQPTDNNKYKSGEYATVLGKNTLVKEDKNSSGQVIKEYQFDGWNTKADYSGETYKEGAQIQINKTNILFFPVWK